MDNSNLVATDTDLGGVRLGLDDDWTPEQYVRVREHAVKLFKDNWRDLTNEQRKTMAEATRQFVKAAGDKVQAAEEARAAAQANTPCSMPETIVASVSPTRRTILLSLRRTICFITSSRRG